MLPNLDLKSPLAPYERSQVLKALKNRILGSIQNGIYMVHP